MKMLALQRKLSRIARELDEVSQELWNRGLEQDWERLESASDGVGVVCKALLDEDALERLPSIADCCRAVPGEGRP